MISKFLGANIDDAMIAVKQECCWRVHCCVQCATFYHYCMRKIAIKMAAIECCECCRPSSPASDSQLCNTHTYPMVLAPVSSLCAKRDHGIHFHNEILKMNRLKIYYWKQINRQRMHYVCALCPQLSTVYNRNEITWKSLHTAIYLYGLRYWFCCDIDQFSFTIRHTVVRATTSAKAQTKKNWHQCWFFFSLSMAVMYGALVEQHRFDAFEVLAHLWLI